MLCSVFFFTPNSPVNLENIILSSVALNFISIWDFWSAYYNANFWAPSLQTPSLQVWVGPTNLYFISWTWYRWSPKQTLRNSYLENLFNTLSSAPSSLLASYLASHFKQKHRLNSPNRNLLTQFVWILTHHCLFSPLSVSSPHQPPSREVLCQHDTWESS